MLNPGDESWLGLRRKAAWQRCALQGEGIQRLPSVRNLEEVREGLHARPDA